MPSKMPAVSLNVWIRWTGGRWEKDEDRESKRQKMTDGEREDNQVFGFKPCRE